MNKLSVVSGLLLFACSSFAAQRGPGPFGTGGDLLVRWKSIVGVITAPGVDNPISAKIDSGTSAWSVQGGNASVSLSTGAVFFQVQGLVFNGSRFSGTPGPVTSVTGTLVCNPGDATQEAALDTPQVPLNSRGNAVFSGFLENIPAGCSNPLFLIRVAIPATAAGRWIATGAGRSLPNQGQ